MILWCWKLFREATTIVRGIPFPFEMETADEKDTHNAVFQLFYGLRLQITFRTK